MKGRRGEGYCESWWNALFPDCPETPNSVSEPHSGKPPIEAMDARTLFSADEVISVLVSLFRVGKPVCVLSSCPCPLPAAWGRPSAPALWDAVPPHSVIQGQRDPVPLGHMLVPKG